MLTNVREVPWEEMSLAEKLALVDLKTRAKVLYDIPEDKLVKFFQSWEFWARRKQLPPKGDWRVWLIRAGRGFGKTKSLSGFFHGRAMAKPGRRLGLLAKTPADARDYNIEGPSGLLRTAPKDEVPLYEPTKRRVTWPNGSWLTVYSDETPEAVRGFSGDTFGIDEMGKFKHPQQCWENLIFGLRELSDDRPRIMIATTPRPLKILKRIEAHRKTIVTHGETYENYANVDPDWLNDLEEDYGGTQLGRQEMGGEYIEEASGALWKLDWLDRDRIQIIPCELSKVVVAIDPGGSSGQSGSSEARQRLAETGIIAVGLGTDNRGYVLADKSSRQSPQQWARAALLLVKELDADYLVAEKNYGGPMVEATIRLVADQMLEKRELDRCPQIKMVDAQKSKQARAEPVATLYEQRRISHVATFPELEDQLVQWEPNTGQPSPDRLDALVWALTYLMVSGKRKARFSADDYIVGPPLAAARGPYGSELDDYLEDVR